MTRVHSRKREKSVTLVYHPCAKFQRGQMHANMSESALIWSTKCVQSYTQLHRWYGETSIAEWGVDLLWHMHIYTSALTILNGREPWPGMIYSIICRVIYFLLSSIMYSWLYIFFVRSCLPHSFVHCTYVCTCMTRHLPDNIYLIKWEEFTRSKCTVYVVSKWFKCCTLPKWVL